MARSQRLRLGLCRKLWRGGSARVRCSGIYGAAGVGFRKRARCGQGSAHRIISRRLPATALWPRRDNMCVQLDTVSRGGGLQRMRESAPQEAGGRFIWRPSWAVFGQPRQHCPVPGAERPGGFVGGRKSVGICGGRPCRGRLGRPLPQGRPTRVQHFMQRQQRRESAGCGGGGGVGGRPRQACDTCGWQGFRGTLQWRRA